MVLGSRIDLALDPHAVASHHHRVEPPEYALRVLDRVELVGDRGLLIVQVVEHALGENDDRPAFIVRRVVPADLAQTVYSRRSHRRRR